MSVPELVKEKLKELSRKRPDKFAIALGNLYKVDEKTGKKVPTLAKWQRAYLLDDSRFIVVKTPRQAGKSTASAIKIIWRAWLFDRQMIIVVAPRFEQAKIIFNKIIELLQQPNNIVARTIMEDVLKINYTGQIWFKNGSRIFVLSAAGDIHRIRGYTANMIVVDEAQAIKDEVFALLEPMLISTKGQMILIGTPLDFQGYFYRAWQLANEGKIWSKHEGDPFDRPWLSREEIEEELRRYKSMYGEIQYMREMLGKFSADEGLFFDLVEVDEVMKLKKRRYPEPDIDYVMGIDPASSGKDETAITILGVRGEGSDMQIEMHWYNTYKRVWSEVMYREVKETVEVWKPKVVVIDTIGLGEPIAVRLQEELPMTEVIPFKAYGRKRIDMYFDLKYLISQGKILLINDEKIKRQFTNYQMVTKQDGTYTIKKKDTGHDDIVDSIALAVQGIKTRYGIEGRGKGPRIVVSERLLKAVNEYFSSQRNDIFRWWGI